MKTPKTPILVLIISAICLSASCRINQEPKIEDLEQLSPFFVYVTINGKRYIDIDRSKCFTRSYRHSRSYIGSVGRDEAKNISHCDRSVGYSAREYVKLNNFKEAVRLQINLNSSFHSEEELSRPRSYLFPDVP